MNINFSGTTLGFYLPQMKAAYKDAGTWPEDAIEMTALEKETYWNKQPPEGKQLGANTEGRPAWVDIPPPTAAEQVILDKRQAKQTGELYADTGITVPFTNEVANGVMQIEAGFKAAEALLAAGQMSQTKFDAITANLEISPTIKLAITPATMLPFSAWFWTKRASFF